MLGALTGFAGLLEEQPRPRRSSREDLPVTSLQRVGPKIVERLARLGIATVRDLAEHLPRTFLDWGGATGFRALRFGQEGTVECTVERASRRAVKRRQRLELVEAVVVDREGQRAKAVWFNQGYLLERLQPGTRLLLHGELGFGRGLPSFRVERFELAVEGAGLHTLGRVPIYSTTEELSAYRLLELSEQALERARWFRDPLPAALRAREQLALRADALLLAHRPGARGEEELARRRLALEELLVLLLALRRRRQAREQGLAAHVFGKPGELLRRYRELLPFELTHEQRGAIAQIDRDLACERPMQRLLQGDVGSGKTVVALYALLRAAEQGLQGALMAPTETLAEQHFLTVEPICNELGLRCALLTSSLTGGQQERARAQLATGEAEIAVGTHALIQEQVSFRALAVAVVDEQHRFGVEQRRALGDLAAAGERAQHVLHMTATPIPRTLAQTLYGDLDITEIVRPPRSRKPVVTRWIPSERSAEAYVRLRKHLADGRQAYVVCPLVSESEAIEARAAEQEAERLRTGELCDFRIGCLHGKLRPGERRQLMSAFKAGELDVLVATTVIEVGVDVPNATIMIVQEADRFGLAQLHQLRGRVGRGAEQSYCLLVTRPKEELNEQSVARIEALVSISDGFELAEIDLRLRGEGQLFGTRQSGMPDLRFARLLRDRALIARARELADSLTEIPETLEAELERAFPDADRRGFA